MTHSPTCLPSNRISSISIFFDKDWFTICVWWCPTRQSNVRGSMGEGFLDLYKSIRKRMPHVMLVTLLATLLQSLEGDNNHTFKNMGTKLQRKGTSPDSKSCSHSTTTVLENVCPYCLWQFASGPSVYFDPNSLCWYSGLWAMSPTDSLRIPSLTRYNQTSQLRWHRSPMILFYFNSCYDIHTEKSIKHVSKILKLKIK